jgi:outer membrane protein TolC
MNRLAGSLALALAALLAAEPPAHGQARRRQPAPAARPTPSPTPAAAAPAPEPAAPGAQAAPAGPAPAGPAPAAEATPTPQATATPAAPGQPAAPDPARAVPAAAERTVAISLSEAIALTFQNNLDLKVEAITPQIRATDIGREQGAFDPTLSAEVQVAQDRSPSGSGGEASNVEQIAGQVALTQRLPLGTEYEIAYNTDRLDTNAPLATLDPSYSAEVLLRVEQPLLRDFGAGVNRTAIAVARGALDIARATFRRAVQDTLFTTVQTYWRVVQTQDALEVARESLRLARRLLEQNRVQVQVGTMAPIEVTQAEASVAAREEDVIVAEAAVADAEDALKRAVLVDEQRVFDYRVVPTDRPEFQPVEAQLGPNLEAARRLRPELQAARLDIGNREASARLARNQLLPEVNLFGSAGLNGLDDRFADTQAELGGKADEQYEWSVGVRLSYPLGNRAARNAYAAQQLGLRQAQTQLRNLELQVIEEVRVAVRAVNTNTKRVEATREATRLAREQLAAEERRLAVGLSTSFEVLRLQTDLATARNREIQAITDYRVSLANLDRVVGTLLERFGIVVKD